MQLALLIEEYLVWHYSTGLGEVLSAWAGIHRFLFDYFSIGVLAKSLFAPYHRMQEHRSRGFDPQNIFETLVINTMMRMVGMVVRATIIALGLALELIVFAVGVVIFCFIVVLPLAVPLAVLFGTWLIML